MNWIISPSEPVKKLIAVPPELEMNTPFAVNELKPVPPWVTARSFVNETVPVTFKLSVTCTVPPAESNIKLPDDVSISLAAVTPILTLSAYTPPNCASCHGDEASSPPEKSSSFVKTNLSVWISNPKNPSATAEPVPHLNLTPRSRPSEEVDVVLSAKAITGSSNVIVEILLLL